MPLDNDTFFSIVGAVFQRCLEVLNEKGHTYAGDDNRLANFERIAARRGISPGAVIDIYRMKHEDSIATFRREGRDTDSEPPEMRYVDDINYLLLDLADAIANGGYEPREEWLKSALLPTEVEDEPSNLRLIPADKFR